MDEQDLRDRLFDAAATEQPTPSMVAADIARGRSRRRRRTITVTGASLGVVAIATASAIVGLSTQASSGTQPPLEIAGNSDVRHSPTPSKGTTDGATGRATPLRPDQRLPHSMTDISRLDLGDENYMPYGSWRNALFVLAREHLDPAHDYLSYDTDNMHGSGPYLIQGIKLGWQQVADTGEGMVDVEVGSPDAAASVRCLTYAPCRTVNEPGYGEIRLGGDPQGPDGYEVILTQADGEIAHVVVNPLFANNSLTPTLAPLPSLESVLALAADSRLDLPSG